MTSDLGRETFLAYGSSYAPSESDVLRPAFMRHVVPPLAHAAVAGALDRYGKEFLAGLAAGDTGARLQEAGWPDRNYQPETDAPRALHFLDQEWALFVEDRELPEVVETLTRPQRIALYRFFTLGNTRNPDYNLLVEATTVATTVRTIHHRHPELGLANAARMTELLRDPHTPGLLRGFAVGGNGFADSLRNRNQHPATQAWRDDPERFVLDTTGTRLRLVPELRTAAQTHRQQTRTATEIDPAAGLTRMAMRFSAGCPARRLGFRTDVPELTTANLSLSNAQAACFAQGENPVMEQVGDTQFSIRRDTYAAMCTFLALGLEAIAQR